MMHRPIFPVLFPSAVTFWNALVAKLIEGKVAD